MSRRAMAFTWTDILGLPDLTEVRNEAILGKMLVESKECTYTQPFHDREGGGISIRKGFVNIGQDDLLSTLFILFCRPFDRPT